MYLSRLNKSLLYSLLGHLLFFTLISFWATLPKFEIKRKIVWVSLPKGISEEADFKIKESKDLPQSTIQEQKLNLDSGKKLKGKKDRLTTPSQKNQALKKAKAKDKISEEQRKIQNALASIDKRLAEREIAEVEAAQVLDAGEGAKDGNQNKPSRIAPTDPEYIAYQAIMRAHIINEWIIPTTYLEGIDPPSAKLAVRIDKQGNVIQTQWEAKSENLSFNTSCLRAIKRASPLPTPPEKLAWEAFNEGFIIEFDPTLKEDAAQ